MAISTFISIAWIRDDEYKKAGFKMMYGGKKGAYSAYISFICAIFMTLVSVLPFFIDLKILSLSIFGFIIILSLGLWFVSNCYNLLIKLDNMSAKKLMMSSLIYLPLMQLVYVIDKWIFM